ncbi:MAG: LysR family transcriptional regulator [Treponema sp.]|nr:LysR family transcriptional regulator [Treponema sp.]
MIETYLLQNLVAFSEEKTLLRTAERLNVSQSALTRAMQKLEEECDASLFFRSKNKIALNEVGEEAARLAREILNAQEEMLLKIKKLDAANREISFASIAPAPIFELNPILKNLYPGVQIKSELKNTEEEIISGLVKGDYHFVISKTPHTQTALSANADEYVSKEYFKEGLKVFVPENHRLAKRKSIHLNDLAGETFLMLSELGFWAEIKKAKIPDAKFITQEESETLKDLVESSNLLTFVTDIAQNSKNFVTYEHKGRVAIPILDKEVNVTFYIICKNENSHKFRDMFESV